MCLSTGKVIFALKETCNLYLLYFQGQITQLHVRLMWAKCLVFLHFGQLQARETLSITHCTQFLFLVRGQHICHCHVWAQSAMKVAQIKTGCVCIWICSRSTFLWLISGLNMWKYSVWCWDITSLRHNFTNYIQHPATLEWMDGFWCLYCFLFYDWYSEIF